MEHADLLIIGSGPGGVAAAGSYREAGGTGRVLIVTADAHEPYVRPPLSKDFLQGAAEFGDITQHDESWYRERNIYIRVDTPVSGLDVAAQAVTLSTGGSIGYRKAIVATGAQPARLPFPGAEHARVLRSFEQATALRDAAETAQSAVVIGAGFIGCEAAASLAARGLNTTSSHPHRFRNTSASESTPGQGFSPCSTTAGCTTSVVRP